MKKIFILVISVIVLALCFSIVTLAEDVVETGSAGTINWEFNETTKTLTIGGSGEMNSDTFTFTWSENKNKVEHIKILSGVTRICNSAFFDFENLRDVELSDTLTSIGFFAFSCCSSLESVTFPASVTSIEYFAFSGCSSIRNITIPKTLTNIGYAPFSDCTGLEYIYVDSNNPSYKSVAGNLYTKDGKELVQYACGKTERQFTVPNGVEILGSDAFRRSVLESVVLPDSLKKIDQFAFAYCDYLTSVNIPDGLESIGNNAFDSSRNLTGITIPDSVVSIGYDAFNGCENVLKKENSIFYVGKWAVSCDANITSATLRSDTVGIGDSGFAKYYKNDIKSVKINDGLKYIGKDAFFNCINLESIEIPDSVVSIGESAFRECKKLTSVKIIGKITSLEEYIFSGCSALTSVELPEGLKTIKDCAFARCENLAEITIPSTVEKIEEEVFNACNNLVHLNIFSKDIASKIISNTDFGYMTLLAKNIYVPKDVTVSSYVRQTFANVGYVVSGDNEYLLYSDHAHEWTKSTDADHYTCTSCGYNISKVGHIYNTVCDADCNACGQTRTPADHIYDNTCDTRCNVCLSSREITHSYDNDCDAICNVCNNERTPLDHIWGEPTVTKEATKKEEGEAEYKCTVCGETKTEVIPMVEGCFGGGGITAAFVSSGGISLVWFVLRRRKV